MSESIVRTRRWTRAEYDREPEPSLSSSHGWAHRSRQDLAAGEHVSPLAAPTSRIAVTDLLP